MLAGGALIAVGLLLFGVGLALSGARPDYSLVESWVWAVELVAVVLLFASRQARWGGLLIGVTAWNLAWLASYVPIWLDPYASFSNPDSFRFYLAGELVAIAGLAFAVIGLRLSWPDRRANARLPLLSLVAVLALGTVAIMSNLLYLFRQPALAALTMLCVTAVLVVYGLAARTTPAAALVGLGWLLGGASAAGIETAIYFFWNSVPIGWVIGLWIGLASTAVAVYALFRTRPRHGIQPHVT